MDSLRFPPKSRCEDFGKEPRSRSGFTLLLALFSTALGACGGDDAVTPTISFRVVSPPPVDSAGACPSGVAIDELEPLVFDEALLAERVRVTYLAAGTSDLVCDTVLDYDTQNRSVLQVPEQGVVDIVVEFFAADDSLLAVGSAKNVDLAPAASQNPADGAIAVEILAAPLGAFACANAGLNTPRALHSATALPDGRVLIIGGVVGSAAGDSAIDTATGLLATNSVEIYDPGSGGFTALTVPDMQARAMHEAYVTASFIDGSATIVVAGGIASDDGPVLRFDQPGLRMAPVQGALPGSIQVFTYAVGTDGGPPTLTHELTLAGATAIPAALDPTSRRVGTRVITAGGALYEGILATLTPKNALTAFDPVNPPEVASNIATPRLGATLTDLGDGNALLWGGAIADPLAPQGETMTGLGAGVPSSSNIVALGGEIPVARAFHTAARSESQVVIAGGFEVQTGSVANIPAPILLEKITPGSPFTVEAIEAPAGSPPVGFMAALPLGNGDVLLSGGSPEQCADDLTGTACAVTNAYLFRQNSNDLVATGSALLISRYGHRMTALGDGRILTTGGLHTVAGTFRVTSDAEMFDSRAPSSDAVLSLEREPGKVATDEDGAARAPCELIETPAPAQ